MGKNAWDGCDAWDSRPKTLPEGLITLAAWFDAVYENQGKNDEVQQDLRKWALDHESLKAKLAAITTELEYCKSIEEQQQLINNGLRAKLAALVEALGWYKEKAQSTGRYLRDKNKSEALLALLTELALDNGSRADTATKEMPHA